MLLALALLACAGGTSEPAPSPPLGPIPGRVGRVAVSASPQLPAGAARALAESEALAVLRQSARDWLEQAGRLAEGGELELCIEVSSLHRRSALATWLFSGLVRPDHLAVRVEVRHERSPPRELRLRAESALSGYAWRDSGERLRRLARRLGRRVAEGL